MYLPFNCGAVFILSFVLVLADDEIKKLVTSILEAMKEQGRIEDLLHKLNDTYTSRISEDGYACPNLEWSGLIQGGFAVGSACSQEFFVCQKYGGGFLKTKFRCPDGLVVPRLLNIDAPQCVRREAEVDCRENPRKWYVSRVHFQRRFTCENRPDGEFGFYPLSRRYAYCANGTLEERFCEEGEEFSLQEYRCVVVDDMTLIPEAKTPQNAQRTRFRSVTKSCFGTFPSKTPKSEGFHQFGEHSPHYYQCRYIGQSLVMTCPKNYYFDDHSDSCEPDEQSTPLSAGKPSSLCVNREDGAYESGECLNHYVRCKNGRAKRMNCPQGFSYANSVCVWHEVCLSLWSPTPKPSPTFEFLVHLKREATQLPLPEVKKPGSATSLAPTTPLSVDYSDEDIRFFNYEFYNEHATNKKHDNVSRMFANYTMYLGWSKYVH